VLDDVLICSQLVAALSRREALVIWMSTAISPRGSRLGAHSLVGDAGCLAKIAIFS
jgi:hypothetical protein